MHQKKKNNYSYDLNEFKKINQNIFDKKISTLLSSDKYYTLLKYKINN